MVFDIGCLQVVNRSRAPPGPPGALYPPFRYQATRKAPGESRLQCPPRERIDFKRDRDSVSQVTGRGDIETPVPDRPIELSAEERILGLVVDEARRLYQERVPFQVFTRVLDEENVATYLRTSRRDRPLKNVRRHPAKRKDDVATALPAPFTDARKA